MNDSGEKTCPLCAEEMDMTDQHLNPCKCGYQICVWCWNHIIEMAEKDTTEGRCPACRTTYDKEKIVGMTVSRESLFADVNKKALKGKAGKNSEGRREQLIGVRVIQRNLVYVMSLPSDIADEDLFQRNEYFGQYGKVVKVALARTQSGDVQLFPNNSCSVYITYSKEEEAVRCIQSVHGFIYNGRNLKVCFGTMKYCHAWLRNTACTNAECLYLHEYGSQEDSFPKNETISAHMKEIINDITSGVENYPRRCGSMLPPPVDGYVDNNESNARKIPKSVVNNGPSYVVKSSPPKGSSNGQTVTLPAGAMWGMNSATHISTPDSDVSKEPALEDDHAVELQDQLDDESAFPELPSSNRIQKSSSNIGALVSASVYNNTTATSVPLDCNGKIHSDTKDSLQPSCVDEPREIQPLQNGDRTETNGVTVSREEVIVDGHTEVEDDDISLFNRQRLEDTVVEDDDDISLFNRQRLEDPEFLSCQPDVANIPRTMFGSSTYDSSMLFPDRDSQGNTRSEIDEMIMANIMSLDLDEHLTKPHNYSKPVVGGFDMSQKLAGCSEAMNNQSRFSFARQDEPNGHKGFESYNNIFNQSNGYHQNSSDRPDMLAMYSNGISSNYLNGNSTLPSSYKPPIVPRYPVAAPPGFTAPSRPPPPTPPGFLSNGREHQTFNGFSGNNRLSDYGNRYQPQPQPLPVENNVGVARDVQFIDPAIMAIGRQGYDKASLDFRQGNTNLFGNEAKLQHQQQQLVNRFNDSFGTVSSRLIDQSQGMSRNVALPNSHWDGFTNEIQRQNILQNERLVRSTNRINGYNDMLTPFCHNQ